MLVCIGAGHGGKDRWNKGPSGYIEADGVLDMALACGRALIVQGVDVIYIRTTDVNLTWSSKYSRDLPARAKFANDNKADFFVSIHTNAGSPFAGGTETFCYKFGGEGEKLAKSIQDSLIEGLKLQDRGVKEANFAVLRLTDMPAALTEVAFHSNPQEEALLKDATFRKKAGEAIAKGIMDYLGVSTIKEERYVLPNGQEITLQGILADKTFYTPARALLNAMGYSVNWTAEKVYVKDGSAGPAQLSPDPNPNPAPEPITKPIQKLPTMEKMANCHVITVKPDQVRIDYIKGALAKDGINGGYFDGSLNPLGLLMADERKLSDRVSWRPARTVFALRYDGTAEILPAVDSVSLLDNSVYRDALGAGPSLLPVPAKTEGFQDDIMTSTRPRSAVGITQDGLVKLVATDAMSMTNLSKLMASLGCVQAMNLDGGGSSQMRFGGKLIRSGDGRKLATAIIIG